MGNRTRVSESPLALYCCIDLVAIHVCRDAVVHADVRACVRGMCVCVCVCVCACACKEEEEGEFVDGTNARTWFAHGGLLVTVAGSVPPVARLA